MRGVWGQVAHPRCEMRLYLQPSQVLGPAAALPGHRVRVRLFTPSRSASPAAPGAAVSGASPMGATAAATGAAAAKGAAAGAAKAAPSAGSMLGRVVRVRQSGVCEVALDWGGLAVVAAECVERAGEGDPGPALAARGSWWHPRSFFSFR